MSIENQTVLIEKVLGLYDLTLIAPYQVIKGGLVNRTWQITTDQGIFILQQINHAVFKNPFDIDHNTLLISDYLQRNYPEYFFIRPFASKAGKTMVMMDGGYYRLNPYIDKSRTINVVHNEKQAYHSAEAFGHLTYLLRNLSVQNLHYTIPDFHNIKLRFQQFKNALKHGNSLSVKECKDLIQKILDYEFIVKKYTGFIRSNILIQFIIHHDTKINNVLFDENDEVMCVIDLDTLMPGYFISDLGDMMRTFLPSVDENEIDVSKVDVRPTIYQAVMDGYQNGLHVNKTSIDQDLFHFAGEYMIYMQAIRFLTDYIQDNVYYGSAFPGQNKFRAMNQIALLDEYSKINNAKL